MLNVSKITSFLFLMFLFAYEVNVFANVNPPKIRNPFPFKAEMQKAINCYYNNFPEPCDSTLEHQQISYQLKQNSKSYVPSVLSKIPNHLNVWVHISLSDIPVDDWAEVAQLLAEASVDDIHYNAYSMDLLFSHAPQKFSSFKALLLARHVIAFVARKNDLNPYFTAVVAKHWNYIPDWIRTLVTLETLKTVYHHNIQELSNDKTASRKLFSLLKNLSNDPNVQEIVRSEYELETREIRFINDRGYSHLKVNKTIRSIAQNLTSKYNMTNTCQGFLEYSFVVPIPWHNIDDFH